MPTLETNSEIRSLAREAVTAADPQLRAEALEQIQSVIRDEYRFAQTAEERMSLQMAGQIFDFIGETLDSGSQR